MAQSHPQKARKMAERKPKNQATNSQKTQATNQTKKAKNPLEGPLEKALKDHQLQEKRKARKALEPAPDGNELKEEEQFFAENAAHPYGTCWKCGSPRRHAGGLPGGSDSYFCPECNEWLAIRESPKDTKILKIIP
jgi:flagellar biosynthesis GTPase FlhF